MIALLRPAFAIIVLFTLLTGLALPLGFTGAAHVVAPTLADGSLLQQNGKTIGSALIGQNFTGPKYFHPRPSVTTDTDPKDATKTIAAPYNAANSAGSNLAPTSKALLDRIKADAAGARNIPGDALTTSASGLDPDISPENAALQVARIAAARGVPAQKVRDILSAHTSTRLLGVIGENRVNVLAVNLALDQSK